MSNTKANKQYKDSMFVDLFCNFEKSKEYQLMLYNALHDSNYSEEEADIKDIRIDDVLYKKFRNDVAFGIRKKVFFFGEHQSTINLNMPLRYIMYLGRSYEKNILVKERYLRNKVRIPYPEFYVFYNGVEEYPVESELRLSDSFAESPKPGEPTAELVVKVININLDKQHPILEKCPILKEYMQFVALVRQYKEEGLSDFIAHAVKDCMEQGILEEYLQTRGSEVENMLIAEYNYEEDIAVQREEAYEDGVQQGIIQGIEQGLQQGLQQGIEQGELQGIELTKKVFRLAAQKVPVEVIATECNLTKERVKAILE